METKSRLLALICSVHMITSALCTDNIDTKQPIVRTTPDPQVRGYFGYSLVLYQVGDANDRDQALSNTRIVVSAPNVNVPGSLVENTGAVYTCPVLTVSNRECSPLSGNPGNIRLYDTEANQANEEKRLQFLGGSMASIEDAFIVCAHRYIFRQNGNSGTPVGRCFYSTDGALNNFETLQPCTAATGLNIGSSGVCEAGTSSVLTRENNGGYTLGLGAPGYFAWRGVVLRYDANNALFRQPSGVGTEPLAYQGYAVTVGRFLNTNSRDFAVSTPRRNDYLGSVNIVTNDASLTVVSESDVVGRQMGEYFGFSLLSADLNGDGFDELLVGAPMYRANSTEPDTGRVYLYINNAGNLRFLRTIVGFRAFSRFGYAMANLGDINGDGNDDIAIGAPFSNINESGTVYIYHSSRMQTLTLDPQQIIIGSNLSLNRDLSELRGFGSALASGVDVDANTYNDLAIGSFMSEEVYLLRTRPLAQVTTSLAANPQIVDLNTMSCLLGNTNLTCFNLTVCAVYTGTGLDNQLNFVYNVMLDTDNPEQRLVFADMSRSSATPVTAALDSMSCITSTVYVVSTIFDKLNPFLISFNVQAQEVTINPGDGNELPIDFSNNTIVSTTGASSIQIETLQDCGGQVCIPDLRLSVTSYMAVNTDGTIVETSTITVGGVSSVMINTNILNAGEDAYQATFTVSVPSRQLQIGRIFGTLNSGNQISLSCPQTEEAVVSGVEVTRVTCSVGNPLAGPNVNLDVTTVVIPQLLMGNEVPISVNFSVGSVNPENSTTVADGSNLLMGQLMVNAQADVTLDNPGLTTPEQLSYSNTPPSGTIVNVTQLGPTFTTSFVVRNSGPSSVRTIQLVINWPLGSTESSDVFYLYPAQVTTSGTGSTVTCSNININPNNYMLPNPEDDGDQEGIVTVGTGQKKRKRRRRSASSYVKGRRLTKRQVATVDDELVATTNRTISCGDPGTVLNCVQINCTILGLEGRMGAQARVNVDGYLDERFFATSVDRFSIIPTAEVRIFNGDFIQQLMPEVGKSSSATISVIPATGPVEINRLPVPWWVIFLAILAAVIVLAVIGGLLWGLGFFKRQKHEELKQRKEELQNLADNGTGPGAAGGDGAGGSTENMIGDGTNL